MNAAAHITLAPVSERAAALLHELHAELLAQCVPDIPAAGSIVLQPPPAQLEARYIDGAAGRILYIESAQRRDYELKLQTPWSKPDWGWEHNYQPGLWQASEERRDTSGRRWHATLGVFADDGFGQLVPVAAA